MIFDKLIEFENNARILDFKFEFENILIWPFIRNSLFSEIINRELKIENMALGSHETLHVTDVIKYSIKTFFDSPLSVSGRFDVIIFNSGVGIILLKDKKWFDRINDYFAVGYEDKTLIIDHSHQFRYKEPRYFKNTKTHDLILIKSILKSKILGSRNPKDEEHINEFIEFLQKELPYKIENDYYKKMGKKLLELSVKIPYLNEYYMRLLTKTKPKIIFCEDGSYGGIGGWIAILLKCANELGIKTGEFQHGVIYYGHPAYNYGSAIFSSHEYKKYLPDYLLTYGKFWSDNTRTPSKKVVIGAPHFYSRLTEYKKKAPKEKQISILVLSNGGEPEEYVRLITDLSRNLGQPYKIIFKLHPTEVGPISYRYSQLQKLNNVYIVDKGDVYDYLFSCKYVVCSFSTVLFEAIGFNIPVFVRESTSLKEYGPKDVGIRFRDGKQLSELIKNGRYTISTPEIKYFWESNWRTNYVKFMNSLSD